MEIATDTPITHCPGCGSEELRKSGIVGGKQRYKCKGCGSNFTRTKKFRTEDEVQRTAIILRLSGISAREISRILNVDRSSVALWIDKRGLTDLVPNPGKISELSIEDVSRKMISHHAKDGCVNISIRSPNIPKEKGYIKTI
tara:strand:- start:28808 stop:29233 length:426 start_codon:yes stop_codon:yes gene_type:complete